MRSDGHGCRGQARHEVRLGGLGLGSLLYFWAVRTRWPNPEAF
jgi:hypothetical protein